MTMEQHYVTFLSPGTFVHEYTTKKVNSWDIEQAMEMAHNITERHNAIPFAFYFTTNRRENDELDSKEVAESPMYYLGGVVETLEEVKARATEDDRILVQNMEWNCWDRIITNNNSWRVCQPLCDKAVVLDWKPRKKD